MPAHNTRPKANSRKDRMGARASQTRVTLARMAHLTDDEWETASSSLSNASLDSCKSRREEEQEEDADDDGVWLFKMDE